MQEMCNWVAFPRLSDFRRNHICHAECFTRFIQINKMRLMLIEYMEF